MSPRVVNVCKLSALFHVMHIDYDSLCMACEPTIVLARYLLAKISYILDVNCSTLDVRSVELYPFISFFLIEFIWFWCTPSE